ncbi:MAG TPA: hypothetical protein VNX68_14730 [Nitrosopumilaceae archaeon]|nr:hypothetical protein [Nitrosopumilaceae archaeon]
MPSIMEKIAKLIHGYPYSMSPIIIGLTDYDLLWHDPEAKNFFDKQAEFPTKKNFVGNLLGHPVYLSFAEHEMFLAFTTAEREIYLKGINKGDVS